MNLKPLLVAILVSLLSVGLVTAQDAAEVEVSDALIDHVEIIEDFIIDTRGLDELTPVTRVFPTREEVGVYLQESIDEQLTPELVNESLVFYYAFDFIDDPQLDIVNIYLTLIEDQIGGFYDPVDKTMNTILISGQPLGNELPLLERIIYAHEFVHALQDQHYSLESLGFSPDADPSEIEVDKFLAVQALVEGDATYAMNLYTEAVIAEDPFAAIGLLGATFTSGSATLPEGTPDILTRELFFPYNAGLIFVTELVNNGGYNAVNDAFAALPQSTEQIIHPEKYFSGELPIPVELAPVDEALGAGWERISEDTLGEFYLRAYMDTQLERSEWTAAVEGWGGDIYQTYQNADGEIAMLLRLVWDDNGHSAEFPPAYELWGETRFGTPSADGCWVGADEAICYAALMPSSETVIARAPTLELAQALVASQS